MHSSDNFLQKIKDILNSEDVKDMLNKKENTLNNSYENSYPFLVNYFQKDKINMNDFVVGSHFVYGWMPTILDLKITKVNETKLLEILNKYKQIIDAKEINPDELKILKETINNSIVGTSKLLHFINPTIFPIWDSNIGLCFFDKTYEGNVNNVENYIKYLISIHEFVNDESCNSVREKAFGLIRKENAETHLSDIRKIEYILFLKGKSRRNELKVSNSFKVN